MIKSKTVAIIGAGACGLVCAKVLLDDDFDVTIFEQERELGGIWSTKSAYANLHSQQPGGTLEFSDLYDGKEYVSWQYVHDYLQKYADLFHITKRIRFETQVISIYKDDLKNDSIPWIIITETNNGEKQTNKYDFIIVATGLYSKPYIPFYPDQHKFAGLILSPSDIKSYDQLVNKHVIVVGCGKSATDMAVLAGRYARSCHMIFRKAHWMIPKRLLGGLLSAKYLCSRLFSVPFTPLPNAPNGSLFCFLHEKFPKIFKILTDIISKDIMFIHGPDLYNDKIFIPQYSCRNLENINIIPDDFIKLKRQGRIIGKLGIINEIIDETTIRLNTGEELQADIIISATGFDRYFPFFSEKHSQLMGLTTSNGDTTLNLYRRILPIGIPNIAFLGFSGSVGNWMIGEVTSHWISEYFLKRLKLSVSKEKMYEEIQINKIFIKKIFNRIEYDHRYYWIPLMETYLNDMGLVLHRTNNWISEYFGIYRPQRLKGLHNERRILAQTGYKPKHFYFSFKFNIFLILLLIFIYLFILT